MAARRAQSGKMGGVGIFITELCTLRKWYEGTGSAYEFAHIFHGIRIITSRVLTDLVTGVDTCRQINSWARMR